MKTFYSILALLFFSICNAQSYTYGIVNTDNYNFKIVAIPDFDASTDASDMGFTLTMPAGSADLINANSLLPGRVWSLQEYDAAFLTSQGLGDGSRDVFQFNNPPGQSLISHVSGEHIDLVSFSVTNMPMTGEMTFLDNTDPVAVGALGVLDSFYNSNIDATTTQDYFAGYEPGLTSIMFDTLSVGEDEKIDLITKVFPNPTKDSITIQSKKTIHLAKLFDITGKLVMEVNNPLTISLSSLPSGVYILKLETELSTAIKRIIKE
ncbi:putative secreted protein (Por secretion system target) [Lacinutrix venerupis]|uniref:T9SS type A sorting domain-containing protein n=1 Tax=Lacinutrix venerupis TaxID=1486034 RepID=UPI000EADC5A8|nr:T9SS type A sorting domain-containing protein [Lacinutrix venerupis]RLJ68679.1 putative secreted protein (Por secretion system target) [Lacinutrix venerupis]